MVTSSIVPSTMQQGIEYACLLLQEHFGKEVEKVARCLLAKDRQPLKALVTQSKLSTAVVESSLAVLIQHHIVFTTEDPKRGTTQYVGFLDHILMRSQFPRLAAVIREESGAVGEYVIETLALHGRCTFPTLQEAVEQACQADRSDSVNSHHEVPSKQEIQEVVHALISSGLLVAANTCDLFTCLPDCAAALLNDKEGQDEPSSKVTGVKRKRPTAAEDMSNRAQARASRSRIIPSVADCANPDSVWRLDFACARQVLRRDAFTRLIASRYSGKEAKVLGAAMRLSERRQGYHNGRFPLPTSYIVHPLRPP
eukprot:TRINITY_DN3502_c0_g1_i4.p1 TRINITY_DN3502_c0_g1~~TRINITY_DN3502_c0_g1_i4.p1  ORF type:complete len:311 (-),score=24.34 TRINITY_DN3502_c0_g1_i4:1-933(-)